MVEKYFGLIARGPVNDPAEAEITELSADVRKVMKDQVAATNITKYWTAPGMLDRELTALTVGTQILGGLASAGSTRRWCVTSSSPSASRPAITRSSASAFSMSAPPRAPASIRQWSSSGLTS